VENLTFPLYRPSFLFYLVCTPCTPMFGIVLYCIENENSISYILLFLTLSMVFFIAAFALQAYYDHIFKPVHRERVVNRLQQGLFDKLHNSDMENYDIA
jgi:ABC-type multidrug transport system fused ATPase/permease subunit